MFEAADVYRRGALLGRLLLATVVLAVLLTACSSDEVQMQTIPYAHVSARQTLDLYQPAGSHDPRPVVVLIHGGSFLMGDSSSESELARTLVDNGFAVAAVNYRLSGEARYPAGAQDVKAAVRWLRANAEQYHLDPDRIAAWGQSAGGWLAGMLGATGDQPTIFDDPALGNADESSAVQAVVSWYGISDFTTMDAQAPLVAACVGRTPLHGTADSAESMWLGEPVATSAKSASTNLSGYVASAQVLPPWYLVHGDSDCLVPDGQSQQLKQALDQAGASATYVLLPGVVHGDPAVDATQTHPSIDFLKAAFGMR